MNHARYDIQTIRDNIQALMRAFDPAIIQTPDGPEEDEIYGVHIPYTVEKALACIYWNHPRYSKGSFFVLLCVISPMPLSAAWGDQQSFTSVSDFTGRLSVRMLLTFKHSCLACGLQMISHHTSTT
jgi:hypothetical protein